MKECLGLLGPIGVMFVGYIGGVILGVYIGGRSDSAFEGLPFLAGLIGAVAGLACYLYAQRRR